MPRAALVPSQAPDAVQEFAFVELHVSVAEAPAGTAAAPADSITVGAGITVTVASELALVPPVPVHTNAYEVVAVSGAIVLVPLGCSAPLQPPEAVQAVALVDFHVNVEDLPLAMGSGEALIDAVGAGGVVVGDAPPPPPPQAASSSDNPSTLWLVVIGIQESLTNPSRCSTLDLIY